MPIDPASGTAPVPSSGSNMSSQLRQLATVIQQASKVQSPLRITKGYVAALDGLNPTQTVSIYIDGDVSTLISGVTFANSYKYPMVGDTVIVVRQGADTLILDRYTQGGDLLAHVLLETDSAISIDIPADSNNYTHLRMYVVAGSVASSGNGFNNLIMQFNSDSSADYSLHVGYALNGATWAVASSAATTFVVAGFLPAAAAPGTAGGFSVIDIPLYQAPSLSKQIVYTTHASSGVGAPNNFQAGVGGGIWGNGQGAINTILLSAQASPATLKAGSEVYVYGV